MNKPIPTPPPQIGLRALGAMLREGHPLAAMQIFHDELGDIFRPQLPGFKPVVMAGPEAAHFVLVEARDELRWRIETDPVTRLLRHGVLVEDGESHDQLRRMMSPALHKRMLATYQLEMLAATNQVTASWPASGEVDMLVEMRKIALLILNQTLFRVDFSPEMHRLWKAVLGVIRYISPGLWMLWKEAPRSQYRGYIQQMDGYLHRIIQLRKQQLESNPIEANDMLSVLILAGLDDELVRDQLLTMLIAGHDTSTALLAWALYLLGAHPEALHQVQAEVEQGLGDQPPAQEHLANFNYLDQVIQEALRLYPPIHLGSRRAARDLEYQGYRIPAGERVIYSIYLTQRHKAHWEEPHRFKPERYSSGSRKSSYTWLAFGGGPRNCIGAAFGQLEARLVLARVLQCFKLELVEKHVRLHMGATLEPHPGVRMRVQRTRL
ncbi:MAG TPA: cytochrome P450 [Anaerolineales bacterium]|nr:cytochrome P450 [Anaerolineales bacterium]